MKAEKISEGVYLVGGPNVSHSEDATVFIVDMGGELIMIDSGAGRSAGRILQNISDAGFDPQKIGKLVLTHCHIDHIGGAPFFKKELGCNLYIHDLDAAAVEGGDQILTAANWYECDFPPTRIDEKLSGTEGFLEAGGQKLNWIHTPGHTPGSICLYLDRAGTRVLFGQDIHGPFLPSFKSDIGLWRESMEKLIALDADILCEGHFGIFQPREKAREYIKRYINSY
jgi:metallo-beta-lactamase class B